MSDTQLFRTKVLSDAHMPVTRYLIHSPYFAKSDEDLQTAWKAMEQVKASGKAKSIGVSNYLRTHLEATLRTAVSPPVINQLKYQPYLQRGNHYTSWMQASGIEVEAFKGLTPLHKGKGGPLDQLLDSLAKKYDATPSAILLRWYIQQNVVAITTTRKPERLEEYKQALIFQLEAAEMEEITQIGLSHHYRAAQQKKFDVDDRT